MTLSKHPDNAEAKGATEDDSPKSTANVSRAGTLTHRSADKRFEEIAPGQDTDFPEPDAGPEHS